MAFLGNILWKALGWAMPGFSPSTLYLVAGALLLSIATTTAYFTGADGKGAAIARANASCELRVSEDARVSAEAMTALLDEINTSEANTKPKTAAEEKAACKRSKLCRGPK